ncbi:hypothetical protein SAMN02910369_00409 [Lachnospiraceae bacterium NE2001]|nr:hypothetical protein SAMN02910369_00409 [Lachnospiraceae bacterium NE2001]
MMKNEYIDILSDDVAYIEEILSEFGAYHFEEDLRQRMDEESLSSSGLARRLFLSHTIIDKWRTGRAKPNGKERFKELGMALGLTASELDTFLLKNGYPRLYIRNPLDGAAKLLLERSAGNPDIVKMYRELVDRLGLSEYTTVYEEAPLATTAMSAALGEAVAEGNVSGWFEQFRSQFAGGEKTQHPGLNLCRFILLYMGDVSINELAVTGELPVTIKNILYPILGGKSVTVKNLREKLIAYGAYSDMTEDEIDVMLKCMKLQPITEPVTSLDMAVLSAIRCAHVRYPLYEEQNLTRIISRISPPQDAYDVELLETYMQREKVVSRMVEYYEKHQGTEEEKEFEQRYTSYADRGLMNYVYDVLISLVKKNCLSKSETGYILGLLKRNEDAGSK